MKKIIKYKFAPREMVVRLSKKEGTMTILAQPADKELVGMQIEFEFNGEDNFVGIFSWGNKK